MCCGYNIISEFYNVSNKKYFYRKKSIKFIGKERNLDFLNNYMSK